MTENQRREWLNKYLQTPKMKKLAEDWGNAVYADHVSESKSSKKTSKRKK